MLHGKDIYYDGKDIGFVDKIFISTMPFIYFTRFPHKNIYLKIKPPAPPPYSNGGPLQRPSVT